MHNLYIYFILCLHTKFHICNSPNAYYLFPLNGNLNTNFVLLLTKKSYFVKLLYSSLLHIVDNQILKYLSLNMIPSVILVPRNILPQHLQTFGFYKNKPLDLDRKSFDNVSRPM
jgi:hypothetical protein